MTNDLEQQVFWESEHNFRPYDHPVVNFFASQRIEYIQSWLRLPEIKSALDVGCGNGFSTHYMRQYISNIWGLDRSSRMLIQHPMKPTGRLSLADAFNLPFADNSFDLVYSWELLHHMSEPVRAIAEMARVSRRYILTAEPNRNNPAQFVFALLNSEHRWVLHYSLPYMADLFISAGLQVEQSGRGGWLFPNITPDWLLPLVERLPYASPLGISNWVLGSKS